MVQFIEEHRAAYGGESICKELPIAPSQYYEAKRRSLDPGRLPLRVKRDALLAPEIERIYAESGCRYGARKTWRELRREQWDVARCTTER